MDGYSKNPIEHFDDVQARNMDVISIVDHFISASSEANAIVSHKEKFTEIEKYLFGFAVDNDRSFADILHLENESAVTEGMKKHIPRIVDTYTGGKIEESREYVSKGYGLMVVRPEVIHEKQRLYQYLADRQIDVIGTIKHRLTPKQYVALYNHAFIDDTKRPHVRRRALGYINHDLETIIIRHQDEAMQNETFMRTVTDKFKGQAGRADSTTIRGNVVYNIINSAVSLNEDRIRTAVDPFKLYDEVSSSNSYGGSDRYLANLPGVHIPDTIIKRLLGADNQKEEGVKICVEMIQRI